MVSVLVMEMGESLDSKKTSEFIQMIYDFLKRYAAKRRKKYVDYANIRRFQIKKVWFFPLGTMVICSTYMFWEKTRCFSCAFRPWPIPHWRCLRPAAPPPRGGGGTAPVRLHRRIRGTHLHAFRAAGSPGAPSPVPRLGRRRLTGHLPTLRPPLPPRAPPRATAAAASLHSYRRASSLRSRTVAAGHFSPYQVNVSIYQLNQYCIC
jgi:hypothetical protein